MGVLLLAAIPAVSADTEVTVDVTQQNVRCRTFLDGTFVETSPALPVFVGVYYADCLHETVVVGVPIP